MTVTIWVFYLMGETLTGEHGTPYIQFEASQRWHETQSERELIERACRDIYNETYPHHPVFDSGWCRQEVKVMGA
jgi:hypothetical protein